MTQQMNFRTNQLRDYASLFSRGQVFSWLKYDFSSINYKIERYDGKWLTKKDSTYLDYLKHVYKILADNYQNEYVFKNEFLNNWLIQELGENGTVVFNEFRAGNSIADLAMFNGCSKVFEIKTELDSDSRLPFQLGNYKKAFNQIYIVVPISKVEMYLKQDSSVGIISYNPNSQDLFTIHREAVMNLIIDPSAIMSILHVEEYKSIILEYYNILPKVTSFNQFKICSELIRQIPQDRLNDLFIEHMKKRNSFNVLSARNFKEFNQLFLALKMNSELKKNMIDSLRTSIQI